MMAGLPILNPDRVVGLALHRNLGTAQLVEHAIRRGEGTLSKDGALVVAAGTHPGRLVDADPDTAA